MTEYLTEQEQIQQLKNWIKQYGLTVLAGIVLALLASSAWHYWERRQINIAAHASFIFDEMLTARAQNNTENALLQANKLLTHYSKTPYAQMAAFMLARDAVMKKNYAEASKQLTWIMDNNKESAIRQIARLRLARVLIAQNKADAALALLNKIDNSTFIGLIDEVRGDAYLAKQDIKAARRAYQLALSELPNAEVSRPILQIKYDNLAASYSA